jgi:hypothetical protein
MNSKLSLVLIIFALVLVPVAYTAETNTLDADLNALMMKIHGKLQGGQHSETNFTDELKQFDTLVTTHTNETPEARAQVLVYKANLYKVLRSPEKQKEVYLQLERDFPDTPIAKQIQAQETAEEEHTLVKNPPKSDEPATNAVQAEVDALITKISTKLQEGKRTEADLADNLKEFDNLYAQHHSEKTAQVAHILDAKFQLYAGVLRNYEKAIEVLKTMKADFQESPSIINAGTIDRTIAQLE